MMMEYDQVCIVLFVYSKDRDQLRRARRWDRWANETTGPDPQTRLTMFWPAWRGH